MSNFIEKETNNKNTLPHLIGLLLLGTVVSLTRLSERRQNLYTYIHVYTCFAPKRGSTESYSQSFVAYM